MKKGFVLLFFLFSVFAGYGQTLSDYARTTSTSKTYNESFEPTWQVSFKNVSNKVITTVQVHFSYARDSYEWDAPTYQSTVQIRVNPGEKATFYVKAPEEIRMHKVRWCIISKVRYADGTICDD